MTPRRYHDHYGGDTPMSENTSAIEEGAKILATWIGYEWDGMSDRDISAEYADWVGFRQMQGGKPALRKVAERILGLEPPPVSHVMGMDEEDRTPVPEGFDAAQWRKADEVCHAMALVADDTECVKIVFAALAVSYRDSIAEAEDLYEIAKALDCECDLKSVLLAVADLRSKASSYRREIAATIREGLNAVGEVRAVLASTEGAEG